MRYTVRPISDRTAFTGRHRPSPFKAAWSDTLELLGRELHMLGGRDVVIECDVSDHDIRIDGQLYARARPATPAIRLAFQSRHGPLVYATDRFDHWTCNVRAITLGLEALRRVDRYGIASRGEQYTGYRQIEAAPANGMTRQAAARLLAEHGDRDLIDMGGWGHLADPAYNAEAHRTWLNARRNTHPDRHNGDRTAWDQVEQAARVLGLGDGGA